MVSFCVFSIDYVSMIFSTSAVDCLERLVSKMSCYVLSGT